MGHIFYIMGKSSSGKDTIFKQLQEQLPQLRSVVLYTTRPIRAEEQDGREYYFVDEKYQKELALKGRIIEMRAYDTIHGTWKYFTADDGQINLSEGDYLVIGTLESYEQMSVYYGMEALIPLYVEVEDGVRLSRALERERQQEQPKYAELCRRFLADSDDFSEENLHRLNIKKRFENVELEACINEIILYIKEHICYNERQAKQGKK
ncbi:guanylate kinase [Lachnospiraceae bacterium LCP25S3_G4]